MRRQETPDGASRKRQCLASFLVPKTEPVDESSAQMVVAANSTAQSNGNTEMPQAVEGTTVKLEPVSPPSFPSPDLHGSAAIFHQLPLHSPETLNSFMELMDTKEFALCSNVAALMRRSTTEPSGAALEEHLPAPHALPPIETPPGRIPYHLKGKAVLLDCSPNGGAIDAMLSPFPIANELSGVNSSHLHAINSTVHSSSVDGHLPMESHVGPGHLAPRNVPSFEVSAGACNQEMSPPIANISASSYAGQSSPLFDCFTASVLWPPSYVTPPVGSHTQPNYEQSLALAALLAATPTQANGEQKSVLDALLASMSPQSGVLQPRVLGDVSNASSGGSMQYSGCPRANVSPNQLALPVIGSPAVYVIRPPMEPLPLVRRRSFVKNFTTAFKNRMEVPVEFWLQIPDRASGSVILFGESLMPFRVVVEQLNGKCFFTTGWAEFVDAERVSRLDIGVFSWLCSNIVGMRLYRSTGYERPMHSRPPVGHPMLQDFEGDVDQIGIHGGANVNVPLNMEHMSYEVAAGVNMNAVIIQALANVWNDHGGYIPLYVFRVRPTHIGHRAHFYFSSAFSVYLMDRAQAYLLHGNNLVGLNSVVARYSHGRAKIFAAWPAFAAMHHMQVGALYVVRVLLLPGGKYQLRFILVNEGME